MPEVAPNNFILYQDENGLTKVTIRFSDEDLLLTELQIAEIYDTTRQNINLHIANIYSEGELESEATGMRYQDIDFELGLLHLQTQFDRLNSSVKTTSTDCSENQKLGAEHSAESQRT